MWWGWLRGGWSAAGVRRATRGVSLDLERGEALRRERARVVVGERDDVAEHLVDRLGIALLLAHRCAGQSLELGDQRLQILVALPVHQLEPARELAGALRRCAAQPLVLLQGGADRAGRLVHR